MSKMQEIIERSKQVVMQNYARLPVVIARGQGSEIWDADGKRYIDLFAGFGGSVLGHCHPKLIEAATAQANRLWHVGNQLHTEPQIELAERLNRHAFAGRAFFCHSGAEANEAAVKLARLVGNAKSPKRWKVISLNKSFHGRTLAMIAATGNPAVRVGFEPDVPGFINVPGGDFDALALAVDDETAGIIMEPIQGEGGVNFYPPDYAARVRKLCDEKGIVLIFDEVWTGCGRTGKYFGHQHFEPSLAPDIMTLGKAAGGGLPVGVMYAKPQFADLFVPGKHGCTLGGNPICMAVSRTIFDVIESESLTDHAARLGDEGMARMREETKIKSKIAEVRGRGLFIGIELNNAPDKIVERALEKGVLINLTSQKVIRLAPPINISSDMWHKGLDCVIDTIATA